MINKTTQKNRGFTIVELLVVIVVIGILAAITVVSYSGVTARANTAAGQAAIDTAKGKLGVYAVDGPTGLFPASWGSLTTAGAATTYSVQSGLDFNIMSGNKNMTTTVSRPSWMPKDTIDYAVCGVNNTAAATSFATVNVVTGYRLGYWDWAASTEVWTSAGTVSGTYNTYTVNCYNVGIAEAVLAVARAMYLEGGSVAYPSTVASINANTAVSAKLPAGVTIDRTTNPTTVNGQTTVRYECYSTGASCAAGTVTGARISFWDYSIASPAVANITLGAVAGGTYYTPAS